MSDTTKYVNYDTLNYYDSKLKAFIATKDAEVLSRAGVTIESLITPTEGSAETYVVYQNYTTDEDESKTKIEIGKIEIPLDKAIDSGKLVVTAATETESAKAEIVFTVANTVDRSTTSGKEEIKVDISAVAGDIADTAARVEKLENTHETKVVSGVTSFLTVEEEIINKAKNGEYKAESASGAGDGETIGEAILRLENDLTYKGTVQELPASPKKGDLYNIVPSADAEESATRGWKFYDGSSWQSINDPTLTARVTKLEAQVGKDKDVNAYNGKADLIDIINTLTGNIETNGSILKDIKDNAGSADSNISTEKYESIDNPETFISKEIYDLLEEEQKNSYKLVNKVLTINEAIAEAKSTSNVTVEKIAAETGFAATYVVKQNGIVVGDKINLPKDWMLNNVTINTCTVEDVPEIGYEIGDKYFDFIFNTKDTSEQITHVYLKANDLVDIYTGTTVENGITVDVNENNEISATISGQAVSRSNITDTFEQDLQDIEEAIDNIGSDYKIADKLVTVKEYIDARVFIGTQAEVDAAKENGEIDNSTFVLVANEKGGLAPITQADIDALNW